MKNSTYFTIMTAVLFSIISCSTNEVYHVFIANSVNSFVALGTFSFFAFLATYGVIYWNQTSQGNRSAWSPVAVVKSHIQQVDRVGKVLICSLVVAYVGYFYSLLTSLEVTDAFTVVAVGCIASLLNVTLSMLLFKDRVEKRMAFYAGLLVALFGVLLFSHFENGRMQAGGQKAATVFIPIALQMAFGLYSDLAKTKLRRSYGINPELLTIMPFAATALLSFAVYARQGGELPTATQVLILLYIGVFPTALFNIYIQKMKDVLGIPMVALISLPRPVYVLIVQGLFFMLAVGCGIEGHFTNPMDKSPMAMGSMTLILIGIFLGNHYGKPIKPVLK